MSPLEQFPFPIEIIRSPRRRTLALQIKQGQVILRLPNRVSLQYAAQFVREKQHWIQKKLSDSPEPVNRQYQAGEQWLYLGSPLPLRMESGHARSQLVLTETELVLNHTNVSPSPLQVQQLLTRWFQQQAQVYLLNRTDELAAQYGFIPKHTTVKTYRARWGSCTADGRIQLNWKLMMAPLEIIDYVIIHELCHLKQHNHSPAFWQLVAQADPNYRQHRQWLKQHGHQLTV